MRYYQVKINVFMQNYKRFLELFFRMSNFNNFINFDDFKEFNIINENQSTKIVTSQKYFSKSQKYLFKIFHFGCHSSKEQKIILDTFYHISKKKNQYLQSYNRLSFFYKSEFHPTFSMKYIPSKTLEQVLRTPDLFTKLKTENIIQCLFAVAEGMAYLHSSLICHGNLCPSNIIIDEANQFYLCDFGLYPIKKIYIKEDDLFNQDYKDPYMKYDEPTFSTDVYSYGVLMCDICFTYLKVSNKIKQDETLQDFLSNSNDDKYDLFPPFYIELISSCMNSFTSERPSFNQIIKIFKEQDQRVFGVDVQQLYKDFINSNYLFNLAAINDSNALNKIGKMYEKGKVLEKNTQKALEYYEKAALLNNSEAQNNYGVLLQEAAGKNKSDLINGAKYLRLSAEKGNIYGMANYAIALLNGDGVEKNFQKAEEYLHKSADLGYSHAQLHYGCLLLDNNPSIAAINEGLNYIKKAINQNSADAYYIFGTLLQKGKFIEKNIVLAMENFKIAADLGNVNAMLEFADGNMKNSPKNEQVALKYYQMAYEKGNTSVKKIIDKIKYKLEGNNSVSKETHNNDNESSPSIKTRNSSRNTKSSTLPQTQAKSPYITSDDFDSEDADYKQSSKSAKLSNSNKANQLIKSCCSEKNYSNIIMKINNKVPIKICTKINLISLGEIVYDRPNYHSKNYIYPVGYQCEREYNSINNPNELVMYKCSVLDGGEFPIFRVESPDSAKVFEGSSPSFPWREVRIAVEKSRKNYKESDVVGISGPLYFGFPYDIVTYMIERLPNAKRCINYEFKTIIQKAASNHLKEDKEDDEEEEEEEEEEEIEEDEEKDMKSHHSSKAQQLNKDESNNEDIDLKQPLENLIKQGDAYFDNNDFINAKKCYNEAIKRGRKDLLLKCAEVSQTFEEKLEYLEQAIKDKIPKSFTKWRLTIMRKIYLSKNNEKELLSFAKRFEECDDFSDAAILYNRNKDYKNSSICFAKAKLNIDNIIDGYQQYDFALYLMNQKDYELAKILLQKAIENNVAKAEPKLKKLMTKLLHHKGNE